MKLSEDDKAILALVHDKPTMTQKEYALELGWTKRILDRCISADCGKIDTAALIV